MEIEKVKNHVKKYRIVYISLGTGVVFASFTYVIMRSNITRGVMCEENSQGELINTASLVLHSKNTTINTINVLEREGRGHPGWPVRNLETKRIFFSQREAAQAFDVPEKVLSGHLNGKFPDVDGLHFERINLEPVT